MKSAGRESKEAVSDEQEISAGRVEGRAGLVNVNVVRVKSSYFMYLFINE